MKQRGALRTQRTAKDLAEMLTGDVKEVDPKGKKRKAAEGLLKEEEEPRYKSASEGHATRVAGKGLKHSPAR